MRLAALIAALALLLAGLSRLVDFDALVYWAATWQQAFQNEMAQAVQALQAGAPCAWAGLLLAAGAYGFVHAVGPGHGKYLIGEAGLGSAVSTPRLLGLTLLSSLCQALWAILLVYGGFFFLQTSAQHMTSAAEGYLAPVSYAAIALFGGVFAWRGISGLSRMTARRTANDTGDDSHDCECSGHGPSAQDLSSLSSAREAAALVASIVIRPFTGTVFLLVIAWQMDIRLAGAVAVIVMGLGTAALISFVAMSSVIVRRLAFLSSDRIGVMSVAAPPLQLAAGIAIIWL